MDKELIFSFSLIAVILLAIGFVITDQYNICRAQDGEFVRGVIWFKCIQ